MEKTEIYKETEKSVLWDEFLEVRNHVKYAHEKEQQMA